MEPLKNIRDDPSLDQKSWAFLNLIGQTPFIFITPQINVSGSMNSYAASALLQAINAANTDYVNQDIVCNVLRIFVRTSAFASQDAFEFSDAALGLARKLYPSTDAKAMQTACGIYANTGAPNNANGGNGDIYFRADGGAGTTIYQRRAGAWVGIV